MQANFVTPNLFVIQAVLTSIEKIISTLSQAEEVTYMTAEARLKIYSDEIYQKIFEKLRKLIFEAQVQLRNIEMTLEEEVFYLKEEAE